MRKLQLLEKKVFKDSFMIDNTTSFHLNGIDSMKKLVRFLFRMVYKFWKLKYYFLLINLL